MPLSITLGYRSRTRSAVPEVLYCGLQGAEADRLSFTPPPGIARTELIRHPQIMRRRYFEGACTGGPDGAGGGEVPVDDALSALDAEIERLKGLLVTAEIEAAKVEDKDREIAGLKGKLIAADARGQKDREAGEAEIARLNGVIAERDAEIDRLRGELEAKGADATGNVVDEKEPELLKSQDAAATATSKQGGKGK